MAVIDSLYEPLGEACGFDDPLFSLPDELWIHILWFLDIPDLHSTSRVCRQHPQTMMNYIC